MTRCPEPTRRRMRGTLPGSTLAATAGSRAFGRSIDEESMRRAQVVEKAGAKVD